MKLRSSQGVGCVVVALAVIGASTGCGQVVLGGADGDAGRPDADTRAPEASARDARPDRGGACVETCAGTCAPGGCVETLASGGFIPESIAIDGANVYWAGSSDTAVLGTVTRVPKDGGAPVTMASGSFGVPDVGGTLAVDATNAYWAACGVGAGAGCQVLKAPIAGGTPTTLFTSGQYQPVGIAVTDSDVFWGSVSIGVLPSQYNLTKMAKGGGAAVTLATSSGSGRVVADATTLYWATDDTSGGVMSVPVGGGTRSTLVSGGSVGLAVDADNVYATTNGAVVKVPKGGGTITTLVASSNLYTAYVGGLVADDTSLYWGAWNGDTSAVIKVAKTGGTPTVLATEVGAIVDLAVDASGVYWTNAGSDTNPTPRSVSKLTPSCACSSPPPDTGLTCGPTTCDGCCVGGECAAGTGTFSQCGSGGKACSVCNASQTCTAGACTPSGSVMLFGGGSDPSQASALGDTWTWDGTGWTQQNVPGPTARKFANMATLNSTVVVFGGTDGSHFLGDTWIWDGKSWTDWSVMKLAPQPSARCFATMAAIDDGSPMIVLYGGQAADGTILSDTWTWDGSGWTQQSVVGPGPRQGATAGTWAGTMLLFGGSSALNGGPLGDTWTFDMYSGPRWSQQAIAGPSARSEAAGGANGGPVLLFGGLGTPAEGILNDTWVAQIAPVDAGTTAWVWTQERVAGPSAREDAALAGLGGTVVLFGGVGGGNGALGDTWTWDGASWTQQRADGPSPRYGAAMAGPLP